MRKHAAADGRATGASGVGEPVGVILLCQYPVACCGVFHPGLPVGSAAEVSKNEHVEWRVLGELSGGVAISAVNEMSSISTEMGFAMRCPPCDGWSLFNG